jgi:hypothetical protein
MVLIAVSKKHNQNVLLVILRSIDPIVESYKNSIGSREKSDTRRSVTDSHSPIFKVLFRMCMSQLTLRSSYIIKLTNHTVVYKTDR